jgi:hypothetical protein
MAPLFLFDCVEMLDLAPLDRLSSAVGVALFLPAVDYARLFSSFAAKFPKCSFSVVAISKTHISQPYMAHVIISVGISLNLKPHPSKKGLDLRSLLAAATMYA